MIHSVPNRGGNAINTAYDAARGDLRSERLAGRPLAQCSPAAAIPYPCFDLNSGPYGSLNTTTGAFHVRLRCRCRGCRRRQSFGGVRRSGARRLEWAPSLSPVRSMGHVCTGTNGCGLAVGSAPTSTAQLVIQGPRSRLTSRQASIRRWLSSGLYPRKRSPVWTGPKTAYRERRVGLGVLPQVGRARRIRTGSASRRARSTRAFSMRWSTPRRTRSCWASVSRRFAILVFPSLWHDCPGGGANPLSGTHHQGGDRRLVAVGRISPCVHLQRLQQG
jgi:hypothetical protein